MWPSNLFGQVLQDRNRYDNVQWFPWTDRHGRAGVRQPYTQHDSAVPHQQSAKKHGSGPYHRGFFDVNALTLCLVVGRGHFAVLDRTLEFH
jgi:hypothetical protein